jgi:hypothetical protein
VTWHKSTRLTDSLCQTRWIDIDILSGPIPKAVHSFHGLQLHGIGDDDTDGTISCNSDAASGHSSALGTVSSVHRRRPNGNLVLFVCRLAILFHRWVRLFFTFASVHSGQSNIERLQIIIIIIIVPIWPGMTTHLVRHFWVCMTALNRTSSDLI